MGDKADHLAISLVWLSVIGCNFAEDGQPNALLDNIDRHVALPKGALPLQEYSRYYAPREGGIEAAYIAHSPTFVRSVREFCETKRVASFPCLADGSSNLAVAGTRKWLADARELPIPSGGGCGTIRFSYEHKSGKVSPAACNGDY